MRIEEKLRSVIASFYPDPNNWKCSTTHNYGENSFLERKNITKVIGQEKYKFIEYTCWDKDGRICIGIGCNPAECDPDVLDTTNQRVISALQESEKGYGQYILLNLYPQVTPTKKELNNADPTNAEFNTKTLPKLLDEIINSINVDVLIFWGREIDVCFDVYEKLVCIQKKSRLFLTVNGTCADKPHWHPAYVKTGIEKLELNRVRFKIT